MLMKAKARIQPVKHDTGIIDVEIEVFADPATGALIQVREVRQGVTPGKLLAEVSLTADQRNNLRNNLDGEG